MKFSPSPEVAYISFVLIPAGTAQAHGEASLKGGGQCPLCGGEESQAGRRAPAPSPRWYHCCLGSFPHHGPADHLPVSQDQTLYHPVSGSCMDCSESDHRIFMNTCNPSSPTQQWLFEHTNSTVLEKFNSN